MKATSTAALRQCLPSHGPKARRIRVLRTVRCTEALVPKQNVAGSNPVSRSKLPNPHSLKTPRPGVFGLHMPAPTSALDHFRTKASG
jgi:hypothetical protein